METIYLKKIRRKEHDEIINMFVKPSKIKKLLSQENVLYVTLGDNRTYDEKEFIKTFKKYLPLDGVSRATDTKLCARVTKEEREQFVKYVKLKRDSVQNVLRTYIQNCIDSMED